MATSQQDPYTDREIERLLKIVRDERLRTHDPDKVAAAIITLGELRATVAVEDLIKLITFKRTLPWERGLPPGVISESQPITRSGRYPAVGSLFEIGKPSLPSLTKLIANHDPKSLESVNALTAIMLIFQENPPDAVEYLTNAARNASSATGRRRLLSAAESAKGPPL